MSHEEESFLSNVSGRVRVLGPTVHEWAAGTRAGDDWAIVAASGGTDEPIRLAIEPSGEAVSLGAQRLRLHLRPKTLTTHVHGGALPRRVAEQLVAADYPVTIAEYRLEPGTYHAWVETVVGAAGTRLSLLHLSEAPFVEGETVVPATPRFMGWTL